MNAFAFIMLSRIHDIVMRFFEVKNGLDFHKLFTSFNFAYTFKARLLGALLDTIYFVLAFLILIKPTGDPLWMIGPFVVFVLYFLQGEWVAYRRRHSNT